MAIDALVDVLESSSAEAPLAMDGRLARLRMYVLLAIRALTFDEREERTMPDPIMIACGASLYTLIAVRVGIVFRRVSKDTESDSVFLTLTFSILWPIFAVLLGFGTLMFGDAGLYGKSGRL